MSGSRTGSRPEDWIGDSTGGAMRPAQASFVSELAGSSSGVMSMASGLFTDFRKFRTASPTPLPSPGSLPGPKMISTTARISNTSQIPRPMRRSVGQPLRCRKVVRCRLM